MHRRCRNMQRDECRVPTDTLAAQLPRGCDTHVSRQIYRTYTDTGVFSVCMCPTLLSKELASLEVLHKRGVRVITVATGTQAQKSTSGKHTADDEEPSTINYNAAALLERARLAGQQCSRIVAVRGALSRGTSSDTTPTMTRLHFPVTGRRNPQD